MNGLRWWYQENDRLVRIVSLSETSNQGCPREGIDEEVVWKWVLEEGDEVSVYEWVSEGCDKTTTCDRTLKSQSNYV